MPARNAAADDSGGSGGHAEHPTSAADTESPSECPSGDREHPRVPTSVRRGAIDGVDADSGFVLAYRDLLLMNRLPAPASVLSIALFTALSLLAGMFLYARLHWRIVDRV